MRRACPRDRSRWRDGPGSRNIARGISRCAEVCCSPGSSRWASDYLFQDLLLSRNVETVAWVEGVGAAPKDAPRYNYTRSANFTDGMRVCCC